MSDDKQAIPYPGPSGPKRATTAGSAREEVVWQENLLNLKGL